MQHCNSATVRLAEALDRDRDRDSVTPLGATNITLDPFLSSVSFFPSGNIARARQGTPLNRARATRPTSRRDDEVYSAAAIRA